MQAVVESGGFQYKVAEESTVLVPRMEAEVGEVLRLPKVLMIYDNKETLVGSPYLEGALVEGRVLSHGKHRKIVVFKYKSKKNYRRKKGHRQSFTELLITRIAKPGEPEPLVAAVQEEEPKKKVEETAAETPRRRTLRRRRPRVRKTESKEG